MIKNKSFLVDVHSIRLGRILFAFTLICLFVDTHPGVYGTIATLIGVFSISLIGLK